MGAINQREARLAGDASDNYRGIQQATVNNTEQRASSFIAASDIPSTTTTSLNPTIENVSKKDVLGHAIKNKTPVYLTVSEINYNVRNPEFEKLKSLLERGNTYGGYIDFILQDYRAEYMERYNVVQTFTVPFLSFYGNTVPIYSFTVGMRNDDLHQEYNKFKYLYDNYLRPPLAIEANAKLKLVIENLELEGYIVRYSKVKDAKSPFLVQLSMDFLVMHETLNVVSETTPFYDL